MIAAITSCTNTSNPSVLIGAGLLAQATPSNADCRRKPWVKTSLAPGSKVVTDYLAKAGLQPYLDQLGFNLVGYGCTTCIGNSGSAAARRRRNGCRAGSDRRGGALGQPQLRRPHSSAGARELPRLAAARSRVCARRPHGSRSRRANRSAYGTTGQPVYLKDIWPTNDEIGKIVTECVTDAMFKIALLRRFQGRRQLGKLHGRAERTLRLGSGVRVRQIAAVLRWHAGPTGSARRHRTARALAVLGDSRDDRSHLAGRSISPTSPPAG